MEETINRLWRGFGIRETGIERVEDWGTPLDVAEEGDNIVVHASIPGVRPEDIEDAVKNDVLTIKGKCETEREEKERNYLVRERRTGSFHRSLRLPDTVDASKAESSYEHSVLTETFRKQETKKAKRLDVKIKS